jgi:hypothetical protein
MIDTTLLFRPSEPFSERLQAPPAKCDVCGKNIKAHCSVHLPTCPYACEPMVMAIGDSFAPLFVLAIIYIVVKRYGRNK